MAALLGSASAMRVRQSDLKLWSRCPLQWRFTHLDQLEGQQSCALTFGTVIHAAVLQLETRRDIEWAVKYFRHYWTNPELLDSSLRIDFFLPRRSWHKYLAEGEAMLRNWWALAQWDSDVVVAREHHFVVPIGSHELEGTADKVSLRYLPKSNDYAVCITDFKTSMDMPTADNLKEDLQFTAYAYATTQEAFWVDLPHGQHYYETTQDWPRIGEWVHLRGPQRKTAGERTERHYRRLEFAVDQLAQSVALRVFVPTISGVTCRYCPYRDPCGLPQEQNQE